MLMDRKVAEAVQLLDRAAEEHAAVGVYAMFSGGDDSLANTIVTTQSKDFRACVHLDTGIGIPETQEYVIETCKAQGWPLLIYRAKDCGQDYEALVMERGFPGPAMHYKMYCRLKERALRVFIKGQKRHRRDRVVLSTGARLSESHRRMGHVSPVRREGVRVWSNPLHDWLKFECLDLIAASGIPRNPVVELIHMSGECLCGAFAEPGELQEIALWYPSVAARIRRIEVAVAARGIAACKWGERPPTKGKTRRDSAGRVSELCQQCELRFEGAA